MKKCAITVFAILFGMGSAMAGVEDNEAPDPALTPGTVNKKVTQDNIATTICDARWIKKMRPSRSYMQTLMKHQLKA